ncbi:MscL family protein, partial [Bacillus thuringiensis]|nr:MscL family protein [Bacillus thuringiensis]
MMSVKKFILFIDLHHIVNGAAFGKIVSSLVKDIITPLLGMVLG